MTKQTKGFKFWFSFSILSHRLSFGRGECTSLPGSSWFPPWNRSPGWQRWWGNGRTRNAFCSGIPAVKDTDAMSKSSKAREIVLSTMSCCMAAQSHKRNPVRESTIVSPSMLEARTGIRLTPNTSETVIFSHQRDSLDHVLDMAADGADCGQLLPVAPPLVHTELKETAQQLTLLNRIQTDTYSHFIKALWQKCTILSTKTKKNPCSSLPLHNLTLHICLGCLLYIDRFEYFCSNCLVKFWTIWDQQKYIFLSIYLSKSSTVNIQMVNTRIKPSTVVLQDWFLQNFLFKISLLMEDLHFKCVQRYKNYWDKHALRTKHPYRSTHGIIAEGFICFNRNHDTQLSRVIRFYWETSIPRTFFCFLPRRLSSRLMWLNSLTSFPRGPLTITVRPFNFTSTVANTQEHTF